MRKALILAVLLSAILPAAVPADSVDSEPVARDESLAIKNNLRTVVAGLGSPPSGYVPSEEEYDLPTSANVDQATKRFYPMEARADLEFTAGKSSEQLGQEYQKKIMAAQAKGDYTEMQRLAEELQTNMMAAVSTEMTKIKVRVYLNRSVHQAIDPEGVVWEAPGAIALRLEGNGPDNARILLAFDPRTLADTQKLSLVDLSDSFRETAGDKTAVRAVVVELEGPDEAVTAWAQGVDKGKILGLIEE